VGFELQDDSDTLIAEASAEATSYTESGLTENTQYTRHVRAYSLIPGAEQDVLTYPASFGSSSSNYTMGFRFTTNTDITITKVKVYEGSIKATIWTDGGTVLAIVEPATSASGWSTFDLASPLNLTSGQTYRIAVYTNPYKNTNMSNVSSTSDISIEESRYSSGDNFPTISSPSTMYGVVNFVYRKDTRIYSGISEEVSIYTAVHDPVDADFTVTPGAFGEADIAVTPPNNQDVGDTGVRIRRSPNADMSGAVIIKDYDVPGYTYTDTVPSGGTWYYAITFRNAEGLETTESSPKSVIVSGPIGVPGNFTGEGTATDTITWSWEEVASVDGYLFQDGSGNTVTLIDAPASSYQETVGGENTSSTKQLRSCITAATQLAVLPPLDSGCTIPWFIDGSRVQQLYTSTELLGVEGLIRKIHWQRLNQGAAASYSNVTVRLGHTSLSELTASFAGNYTEGDDKIVWFASTYAVEATTIDYAWYELTLTDEFYYNGTDNLIVDINVESGDSTIGWTRGDGVNSMLYGYPGGTIGSLQQRKLYIWLDVDEVTNQSTPAGPVTAYSMIHDATTGDFMLTDTGSLGVDMMLQQPPNATAGLTGVKVERADDEFFTSGVTEVQAFAPIYSLTDTVPAPGTYWYRITYRNGNGKESVTSPAKDVVVTGVPVAPVADFTATPTSGLTPLTVLFNDLSTGTITSWLWDFGDGVGTSTEKDPAYEYTAAGLYTVSLTVTGPAGSDPETKVDYITVTDPPAITGDFYAVPTAGEVISTMIPSSTARPRIRPGSTTRQGHTLFRLKLSGPPGSILKQRLTILK
jgi:PKD repeat protein